MTLNLTSDLVSRNWCISPIFFEIGSSNLVCKCILGCLSVTNHFWVTVTFVLWSSFQELLCPEHISNIIWCRNPKFGMVIPLGMAEWCIPVWVTLTMTLTSGLISRFYVLYYSYFSSNVCYARPIPLGAFVTCLCHFLFKCKLSKESLKFRNILPVGNSVRSSQSANYELCFHGIFVD